MEHMKRASVINSAGIDAVIFLLNGQWKADIPTESRLWHFSDMPKPSLQRLFNVSKAQLN